MSFTDGNNGMYMPVAPAYGYGYGGNGGFGNSFGGDGAWWLLVLLFAMGGWGNNSWGANSGGVMPYVIGGQTDSVVQRGFDQAAVTNGIAGLQSSVSSGFSGVQQSLCNGFAGVNSTVNSGLANAEASNNARQIANMQQGFAMQSAMNSGINSVLGQIAECCYENRLATAQLGALVQSENCEDRNALNNGIRDLIVNGNANTQRIVDSTNEGFRSLNDKLCQLELDGIKRDYENRIALLQNALDAERQANQNARFDASQLAQTASIEAGQRRLANEVEQYIRPQANPAYIVANPNCCGGCGNACGF